MGCFESVIVYLTEFLCMYFQSVIKTMMIISIIINFVFVFEIPQYSNL